MSIHSHPSRTKSKTPPINPNDRPAELDELDFENDKPTPSFGEIITRAEQVRDRIKAREVGLGEATHPGEGATDDDLAPETLIHEDGARSGRETGENLAADQQFSTVGKREIGAGYGLDEAELAHVKPLDGKKWDDDEDKSTPGKSHKNPRRGSHEEESE